MSTETIKPARDSGPVITEEDLAAFDTTSVVDVPLAATDPFNGIFLKIGTALAVGAFIVMGILITIAVVMRYLFNSSIAVAAEGPTYLLPWLIAGGAIVAQSQMAHVGVDYFLEKFKGKAYEVISFAIWIFVALLMAYVAYLSIYMAGPMAAQETPIMGWPMLGSFSALIVMSICMSAQAFARAYYFRKNGAIRQLEPGKEGTIPTEAETARGALNA